jgi:hypothetical protein
MGKIQNCQKKRWLTSVEKRENAQKALTLAVHKEKTLRSARKILYVEEKKYRGNPVSFYMLGRRSIIKKNCKNGEIFLDFFF